MSGVYVPWEGPLFGGADCMPWKHLCAVERVFLPGEMGAPRRICVLCSRQTLCIRRRVWVMWGQLVMSGLSVCHG